MNHNNNNNNNRQAVKQITLMFATETIMMNINKKSIPKKTQKGRIVH